MTSLHTLASKLPKTFKIGRDTFIAKGDGYEVVLKRGRQPGKKKAGKTTKVMRRGKGKKKSAPIPKIKRKAKAPKKVQTVTLKPKTKKRKAPKAKQITPIPPNVETNPTEEQIAALPTPTATVFAQEDSAPV